MDDTMTQDMPPWEGDKDKIASNRFEQGFFDRGDEIEMSLDELAHGGAEEAWMSNGDAILRAVESRAETWQNRLDTQADRFAEEAEHIAARRSSPEAQRLAEALRLEKERAKTALRNVLDELHRVVTVLKDANKEGGELLGKFPREAAGQFVEGVREFRAGQQEETERKTNERIARKPESETERIARRAKAIREATSLDLAPFAPMETFQRKKKEPPQEETSHPQERKPVVEAPTQPSQEKTPEKGGLVGALEKRLADLQTKIDAAAQYSDEREEFMAEATRLRQELAAIERERASQKALKRKLDMARKVSERIPEHLTRVQELEEQAEQLRTERTKGTDVISHIGKRERVRQAEDAKKLEPKILEPRLDGKKGEAFRRGAERLSDGALRKQIEIFEAAAKNEPKNPVLAEMANLYATEERTRTLDRSSVPQEGVERERALNELLVDYRALLTKLEGGRNLFARTKTSEEEQMALRVETDELPLLEAEKARMEHRYRSITGKYLTEEGIKARKDLPDHVMREWAEKYGVKEPSLPTKAIEAAPTPEEEAEMDAREAEQKKKEAEIEAERKAKEAEAARKAEQEQRVADIVTLSTSELERQMGELRSKMEAADVPDDNDVELFEAMERTLREKQAAEAAEERAEEEAEARAKALEQKLAAEAEAIAKKNREAEAAQPDDKAKAEALFGKLGKEAEAPTPSREEALNAAEALFKKKERDKIDFPLWQDIDTPGRAREAYIGNLYRAIAELDQLKDEEKPRGREDLLFNEMKTRLDTVPRIEASLAKAKALKDQKMIDVLQEYLEERQSEEVASSSSDSTTTEEPEIEVA